MEQQQSPSSTSLWLKRPIQQSDYDFVIYTWLESYKYSPEAIAMGATRDKDAMKRYWVGQERVAQRLVEKCETTIAESTDASGAKIIVGWVCGEADVIVHYCLSRRRFQRMGVATDLMQPWRAGHKVLYSHKSSVKGLKMPENFQYDPYCALKWLR